MGCVDGAMGHGRQQHEWMHQHQHDYSEHSREHERIPDPPPPKHEWIPSTPEAAGTSHRLPTATGPLAASTPGFAHVVSGQILKEHWVPNNISGALENDSECQMVTPADDDHNTDAEIAHNTSLEDTSLAERGILHDNGNHHAPHNQSPSGDHHAPHNQTPSGNHSFQISENPDGAHGAPQTVTLPYGHEWSARLSPALDQIPMESPNRPLGDSQTFVKHVLLSLSGEHPNDTESHSPLISETMHHDRDGLSPAWREVCMEVSYYLHFTCLLKMKLLGKLCAKAHRQAVRRLANRHGSWTVFHVPLLVQAKKSILMVTQGFGCTLPLTVPARDLALCVSVTPLVKMTGAQRTI